METMNNSGQPITGKKLPSTTPALANGIAVGDLTQNSAILWTRSKVPGNVKVEYATNPNFTNSSLLSFAPVVDTTLPVKLDVINLSPGTTYYYRVIDPENNALVGKFKTPAKLGDRNGLRFGVSSCSRGELSPFPSIANAASRNLDFFVRHGDTIYADYPSPAVPLPQAQTLEEFRRKHSEPLSARYNIDPMAELRASTATIAVPDDHEVADDYAGGGLVSSDPEKRFGLANTLINQTPLYQNGIQTFVEYNPIREKSYGPIADPVFTNQRNLYSYVNYGSDASIFRLDTRSFRDQKLTPPDLTKPETVQKYLLQSFDIDPATGKPTDTSRTLLGRPQIEQLKRDLLKAQADGVTWKMILLSMSIQNLGIAGNSQDPDRYEGYAKERAEILDFIRQNKIENVVWVVGDVHSTIVNNVTYQKAPGTPQILTDTWEVTTGSIAFDPPAVPFTVQSAAQAGVVSPEQLALYKSLPNAAAKDAFAEKLFNGLLTPLGYDTLGLKGSESAGIDAQLLKGSYLVGNTFGWSEFNIDPVTQQLKVTTYGIDPYTQAELEANPNAIITRQPQVFSEFVVNAKSTIMDKGDRPMLVGDSLNNTLQGSAINNQLSGADGNDILIGGLGKNALDGGPGIDTASYVSAPSSVKVNLAQGSATSSDGAIADALINIENITGSGGNDELIGNSGNNELRGGTGADTLTGGGGSDRFFYKTVKSGLDIITDFGADDSIVISAAGFASDLASGIDLSNNQASDTGTFVSGKAPTSLSNNAHFLYNTDTGMLSFDPDGTGNAPAIPLVTLLNKAPLKAEQLRIIS